MPWILEDETVIPKSQNAEEQQNLVTDEEQPQFDLARTGKVTLRGAAKGFGGYGSTLDYLGIQAQDALPGQKARYGIESDILGKMQDPNYSPRFEELSYLSEDDDVLPNYHRIASKDDIAGMIDRNTGGRAIPQTALEEVLSGSAETGVDFLSMLPFIPAKIATGLWGIAAKNFGKGVMFGAGAETAKEAGAGTLGQLGAGIISSEPKAILEGGAKIVKNPVKFAKEVVETVSKVPETVGKATSKVSETVSKAPEYFKKLYNAWKTPTGTPKFLEEAGTKKALADLELSSKDLTGRTAQISEHSLKKFEDQVGQYSNVKIGDITDFSAEEIEKDIVKNTQGKILDTVAPEVPTHKEGWEKVRDVVEEDFGKAKEEYTGLYDTVEEASKNIKTVPTNTFEAAKNLSKEMKATLFYANEEAGVKNAADTMVAKLVQPQGEIAESLVADLKKEGIYADYENVLSILQQDAMEDLPREVALNKLMATKRSVHRILEKSDIIPAPVDLLKKLSKALKKDIYKGLEKAPKVGKDYLAAETKYAQTQELFNNDAIVKFRKSPNPETMSGFFSSPSNKERLNNVLTGKPQVSSVADRMVIEHTTSKGLEHAKDMSKELKPYLGTEGKQAIDKVLEYGDKLTTPGQQAAIRGKVLEELQESFTAGTRPDFTLKLMQNDKGYKLVADSLSRSPKGRRMWSALKRQSLDDLMSSVVKDGKIDFLKAKDILKNPHTRRIIQGTTGQEGLKFFESLETYGKNFANNLELLEKQQPGMVKELLDSVLTKSTAGAAGLLLAVTPVHSVIPATFLASYLAKEGLKLGKRVQLYKILESPQAQQAIKKISAKDATVSMLRDGLKQLARIYSENSSSVRSGIEYNQKESEEKKK
jgi:hypothetical protein